MAKRKVQNRQPPPHAERSAQGQMLSDTPEIGAHGIQYQYMSWGDWLGDPTRRRGNLDIWRKVPTGVKVNMLRDKTIRFAHAFVVNTLLRAERVIECADARKQKFFEAMFRAWERKFVLKASMAIALGSCGLVTRFEFALPDQQPGDSPVWDADTLPYIVTGFDSLHPTGTNPRFDTYGYHFQGIDTPWVPNGHVDQFYSLWVTSAKDFAFDSYFGLGRLESAYKPWWMGDFVQDNFLVYEQRFADPSVRVDHPPGKDEKTGKRFGQVALDLGDAVRSGVTVAMPSDVYTVADSVTGEEKATGVRKWDVKFMEAVARAIEFINTDTHFDKGKLWGYLLPPQMVMEVGGGQLGGPTTSDVLGDLAIDITLMDAVDFDDHLNKYVFPKVDRANFPPDSPPARVRTVGVSKANRENLRELIKLIIGRQDQDPAIFDLRSAMEKVDLPTVDQRALDKAQAEKEKKAEDALKAQAEAAKAKAEAQAQQQNGQQGQGDQSGKQPGDQAQPAQGEGNPVGAASADPISPDVISQIAGEPLDVLADDEAKVSDGDIVTMANRLREMFPEAWAGTKGK